MPTESETIDCGSDCKHVMYTRCPRCRIENYAVAVWHLSHTPGVECRCGHVYQPKLLPQHA